MTARERTLVTAAVAAALCGGVIFGGMRLSAAREAASTAAKDLAECRRLAAAIEAHSGRSGAAKMPIDGPAGEVRAAEVTRRIENAAKAAGFPGGIERIEPAPARRVEGRTSGNIETREMPTLVQLRGVTLRQALTFFHDVTGTGRPSLRLSRVRLSAPSPDDTTDRWAVESTLTYRMRAIGDDATAMRDE